jgi:hypothetical protein
MEEAAGRKYVIATDVGGTCTDTVVFAAGEPILMPGELRKAIWLIWNRSWRRRRIEARSW